jgi:NhaP-type Na+/H+ and K+/H+ antiporter
MNSLDPVVLIIIFSSTIIISYFFNLYSKKSGVPSVLMLIFTGMLINFGFLSLKWEVQISFLF